MADTLAAAGPDAATLCEGWTTADLAAHLVVRDRRVDSTPGLVVPVPALQRWTERVRAARRDTAPYAELVADVRAGPFIGRLPAVDDMANIAELAVHHEDVRRAGPSPAEPRALSSEVQEALWSRLRPIAFMNARPPRGRALVFAAPDGRTARVGKGPEVTTVAGEPLELLLWAFGRRDVARVTTS